MNNARLILKLTFFTDKTKYLYYTDTKNVQGIKVKSDALPFKVKDCCTLYTWKPNTKSSMSKGLGKFTKEFSIK